MRDLSVIITARNEMFLKRTVEEVLEKKRGNTEIIVVLDGAWADPALEVHDDVTVIYNHESIGQRAAINQAARLSTAKFIMKLDAHCALDEGFDVKLMADCEYDWTVVPRMYNLHAFNWKCNSCSNETYQGPTLKECEKCAGTEFERVVLWKAKRSPETDHMRFDRDLKFQYWSEFKKRPEAKGDIVDTMSILGACFFLHRQRYWELGGSDEEHGSWGQQGTEIACKTWLSGGRLVTNKKTWYAHMFRTQGGDFGFPYPLSTEDVEKARARSRDMWMGGKWPQAIYDLDWLIRKFAPIPDWDTKPLKKGIIYYTDNGLDPKIEKLCQDQLLKVNLPIVSASLKPMDFGKNIHVPLERGWLTMFKQILAALEASDADIIFFCESDVLYHKSHFDFTPTKEDVYYYNVNVWKWRFDDGLCVKVDDCRQLSGLCGYRNFLITHYKERIRRVETEGFSRNMGFEPGTHNRKERVDNFKSVKWNSAFPNIDIRHGTNATKSRWTPQEFRDQRYTTGWKESNIKEMEGWNDINL